MKVFLVEDNKYEVKMDTEHDGHIILNCLENYFNNSQTTHAYRYLGYIGYILYDNNFLYFTEPGYKYLLSHMQTNYPEEYNKIKDLY